MDFGNPKLDEDFGRHKPPHGEAAEKKKHWLPNNCFSSFGPQNP